VFIIILLSSCTSNQSTSNVPKFSIVYPEKPSQIRTLRSRSKPLEPGLTNIRIKLKNADSQVYEEEIRVYKYPYEIPWVFKKPGIYSLVVEGYSISENRWYTANGTITVYDVIPPIIEEVRILPERPYVGDEVMLQMKVKSQNPIVNYYIDGKTSDSLWINQTLVEKAGYVYKKLSPINSAGKVELFLKTAAYNMEDATKVTFEVNQVDRVKPVINVFTKDLLSRKL